MKVFAFFSPGSQTWYSDPVRGYIKDKPTVFTEIGLKAKVKGSKVTGLFRALIQAPNDVQIMTAELTEDSEALTILQAQLQTEWAVLQAKSECVVEDNPL